MAITFVAATQTGSAGVFNRVVNVPGGTLNGHFMLLFVGTRGSQTIGDVVGWTPLEETQNGTAGSDARLRTFWRFASSEPASYIVTISASGPLVAGIVTYSNVDFLNPIDNWGEATTNTAPSVDVALTTGLLLHVCCQRVVSGGPISATKPASHDNERIDVNTGAGATDSGLHVFDDTSYADPTGTDTDTHAAAGGTSVTQHIVLQVNTGATRVVTADPLDLRLIQPGYLASNPTNIIVDRGWDVLRPRSLGCGTWTFEVVDRVTGAVTVGPITTFLSGKVTRALNAMSTAEVLIAESDGCLGQFVDRAGNPRARTWSHLLRAYRDGDSKWEGPLTTVEYQPDGLHLVASDALAWLARRRINGFRDFTADGEGAVDAAGLAYEVVTEALGRGAPGVTVTLERYSGVPVETKLEAGGYVLDVLTKLAELGGLDFTALGSSILLGPELAGPVQATLLETDFLTGANVVERGWDACTDATVIGEGVEGRFGGTDPFFGLVEQVVKDTSLLGLGAANATAYAMVQYGNPPPVAVEMPGSARLAYDAPVAFDALVPGIIINVAVERIVLLVATMRLSAVEVTMAADAGESVGLTLVPVGVVGQGIA